VAAVCCVCVLTGQTKVNLQYQSKSIDFSSASATKPAKTGAVLPATCSVGEAYVLTTAPAGQNWYLCSATNIWSQQGGSSSGAGDMLGLSVAQTDNTHLTIGSECKDALPCRVNIGDTVYSFQSPASAILSGLPNGTAYIYVSSTGNLTIGHNTLALTCSGCNVQSGVTGFPAGSLPIASWTALNGNWISGNDLRAPMSRDSLSVGTGLVSTTVSGRQMVSLDSAFLTMRTAVPSTATAPCTQGSWAADNSYFYVCYANNSWRRMVVAAW
jgi:hypothetical protein